MSDFLVLKVFQCFDDDLLCVRLRPARGGEEVPATVPIALAPLPGSFVTVAQVTGWAKPFTGPTGRGQDTPGEGSRVLPSSPEAHGVQHLGGKTCEMGTDLGLITRLSVAELDTRLPRDISGQKAGQGIRFSYTPVSPDGADLPSACVIDMGATHG